MCIRDRVSTQSTGIPRIVTMDALTLGLGNLRRMDKRVLFSQMLNLSMIVFSALMIWKSLMWFTEAESPVVVVLSGSMEPLFFRGDILFLNRGKEPFRTGEVCVFKITGRDIPIVHRIIKVHERPALGDGSPIGQDLLTKGDNNNLDDRSLYNEDQLWVADHEVIGRTVGYLPYLGMVTIIMNDYPMVKYITVGLMGFFVLSTVE
eukprot:TRINITY_DN12799_c0_g1_i2.p1 TRINITY_DN12799_c0_g1~~TRINITY_DN12799_c0_g1_i2.p1  ORF type:complete len:205 (-),score=48.80 TRINITY_DN12799_c0_g1_i2:281-895(-)